jgi:hypothetical protein
VTVRDHARVSLLAGDARALLARVRELETLADRQRDEAGRAYVAWCAERDRLRGELDETGERLVKANRERNQARLDFQALVTERDRLRDGDIAIYREAQGLRAEVERLRGELEGLKWAEVLTEQGCAEGRHTEWYLDSENLHACPWCEVESLHADRPAYARQVAAATLRMVAREHLYRVVGSDGERVAVLAGPGDMLTLADRMAAGQLEVPDVQ